MPKIFQLHPHVADLIAAGEVVERPASVVKELIENSIDAGAGIITIEISAGGMTFIRVTDNGCGIAPEDAATAFLRHATSKLRGPEGLEAIGTLGFRGEALAAIAAVSHIEILTRERGADQGVSLTLEAGVVADISPAGCPEGTTIIVRNLFFNTPARLKFMKSDRAEASAVTSAALRCALSRPEVSFRFIRDGKTEYHTPGDSRIDSCVYSLLGREFLSGLKHVKADDEAAAVEGYICAPEAARGNRSYQFFFINGRPIRSVTLQAALEQAYTNMLPSGRFPSCVLYITTGCGNVDVNVHPAKTEVKFASDKDIFSAVHFAALGALTADREQLTVGGRQRAADKAQPAVDSGQDPADSGTSGKAHGRDGFMSMSADKYRKLYGSDPRRTGNGNNTYSPVRDGASGQYQTQIPPFIPPSDTQTQPKPGLLYALPSVRADAESPPEDANLADRTTSGISSDSGFRVIGEALKVYIIVEYQGSVWFIDKHAAHERVHFDALKSEGYEPMSQALITPVVCRHGAEDASLLFENDDLLDKLGFTIESFGDDSVAVRHIPAEIEISDTESVLSEICRELRQGGTAQPARRDNIFRAIACKAAIKAGKSSTARELEALAFRVISGEASQCPHGRPVAFEISKGALDKGFRRI